MKKIKVLHTEWSDGWGGQEIRIINEAIAIREKYEVEIFIACRENSKILQKANEANIKTFILPFRSNFDIKTIFGLIKIIKKNKIDIINTHSGKDTWVGGIAAKLAGIKFIRTRHLSNKINPSRLNFINSLADFIITTGESVKEAMIKENRIDKDKIISIPTGINDNIFNPEIYDKDECLKTLNLENDKIYVGNLAVLRAFKRHDVFLKIALKIHKDFPNIIFLIAGDGPKKQDLIAFIKQNNMSDYVKLLGHCKNPEIFLKAIHIFMLTSDSKEGVPQSLMQALLMKNACISTNIGSIPDLYNGSNFIMTDFDEEKLYSELKGLLSDKEKVNFYQNNAREFVKNNFTKDIMANKIYEIYKRIL
ncbi:glycosyltransferase family 4 protein [Campylobacter corcagiensis]|uniref:glycosyltransferase family 4 protein n=1 Tax=Campylobacter corcagiensis TaxID=1448857 RepID=UPI000472EDBF|nr:glycosyltransferase family 4 protein [Campylobacter corcagiensis]QKF65082.1 glycosyltransferase, family 1 [Campylobacter corcagiensis]